MWCRCGRCERERENAKANFALNLLTQAAKQLRVLNRADRMAIRQAEMHLLVSAHPLSVRAGARDGDKAKDTDHADSEGVAG
jgi:hypothetical protein